MPKDTDDCEIMNELFDSGSDDIGYYNHWRPVAIVHPDGEKIRDLTKQEQLEWIKQQKLKEKGRC